MTSTERWVVDRNGVVIQIGVEVFNECGVDALATAWPEFFGVLGPPHEFCGTEV